MWNFLLNIMRNRVQAKIMLIELKKRQIEKVSTMDGKVKKEILTEVN